MHARRTSKAVRRARQADKRFPQSLLRAAIDSLGDGSPLPASAAASKPSFEPRRSKARESFETSLGLKAPRRWRES